ncbi:MAG: hypothetical protein DRI77_10285 [Chloroflexi bacterium]|nr:MAG: hypothetical protein DRI77_10285 [Chloroflexota bacterium]
MRLGYIGLIIVFVVAVLVGCSGEEITPAPADAGGGETYTSEVLDTSYPDALNASSQLALGMLLLGETENRITSEQAAALLPLWQALQGGVTAQAEVEALLKQIEGTMTAEQLETIAAMQLTQDGMRAWMQEQGLGLGAEGMPGGGMRGDLSEEEREELRATREAGGGGSGGGPGANLSDEERENLRATMESSGSPGGSGAGGRPGQFVILLDTLVELLTHLAAE